MNVSPVTERIGAVVEGVDLAGADSAEITPQIKQALAKHLVLYFPSQSLDRFQLRDDDLFGELNWNLLFNDRLSQ